MIAVLNFYIGMCVGAALLLVAQAWIKGLREAKQEEDIPLFVRRGRSWL